MKRKRACLIILTAAGMILIVFSALSMITSIGGLVRAAELDEYSGIVFKMGLIRSIFGVVAGIACVIVSHILRKRLGK